MKKLHIPKFLKRDTRPMWLKLTILIGPVIVIFFITGIIGVGRWYDESLKPRSPIAAENVKVEIEQGSSARDIGRLLYEKELIRNATVFAWYVDREGLRQKLQAGRYNLNAAYSVPEIVTIMVEGKIDSELITIIPGTRLDEVKGVLSRAGYGDEEIQAAFDKKYRHSLLSSKPNNDSLEGYIFPETYQLTSDSELDVLLERAFDEFASLITPDIRDGIREQNLTFHEAVILASIIEKEVSNASDRPIVAQIFLRRLKEDIQLGADATFVYAAAVDGEKPTIDYDSPYNTRINKGLPPGPISNFSLSALKAVAFPADTNYLYFVSGDDGKTYFSNTLDQHEINTEKHCVELCKLPQ